MQVVVSKSPATMGQAAAQDVGKALRSKLSTQSHVRIIFAAAPSQRETLKALRQEAGIEWQRVTTFHMDEYLGLAADAPQRFGTWLQREFFQHVPLAKVHLMQPDVDAQQECLRYTALLKDAPIDFVLLGIGTNGHLAFNDPPADLKDPLPVKIVLLDQMCREQQVNDGCFANIEDVPKHAITVTIPTLLSAGALFCSVPGRHKSAAVKAMLESPISGDCPATALRTHPQCMVYLDHDSNALSAL